MGEGEEEDLMITEQYRLDCYQCGDGILMTTSFELAVRSRMLHEDHFGHLAAIARLKVNNDGIYSAIVSNSITDSID